jgi:hypothetical protein
MRKTRDNPETSLDLRLMMFPGMHRVGKEKTCRNLLPAGRAPKPTFAIKNY